MAFQTAAGYTNLPNGNFSSTIFSKKVQVAFRKKTVCGEITNSDYFGEIANQGDTVRILKEPEIEVAEYARGTQVNAQDLAIKLASQGQVPADELSEKVAELADKSTEDLELEEKLASYTTGQGHKLHEQGGQVLTGALDFLS